MCGIVGYIGKKESKEILISGLRELEYRGYDSAGIAVLEDGEFSYFKAVGKLVNLEEKTKGFATKNFSIGIAHTRWATHGKPSENNAHPHLGDSSFVVHNGIIENYGELKNELLASGVSFLSQTDTEVIVHLFEKIHADKKDAFEAYVSMLSRLEGAYAMLLISKSKERSIFFAKHGSPMIIGKSSDGEIYFASSDAALIGQCESVYYLEDGEYGEAKDGEVMLYEKGGVLKKIVYKPLAKDKLQAQKDGFRYFMEKEIYEQSSVVADTMMGRVGDGEVSFDEFDASFFDGIDEIKLCACGTSYHAALVSSYLLERFARVKTSVEIASEFRYKDPLLSTNTLFVVISQSGETADTLEALKMAKKAGLKSLAICNVDNSSIVRSSDASLLTRAGIEKGVASTKAFTTQVIVLWILTLYIAQLRRSMSKEELKKHTTLLRETPKYLAVSDDLHERIKRLSKRYLHGHGFFFIGRDIFYPLALEGALKLKEISYLHAEGYPAGEMKHGPIALADPELFTIALMPRHLHYDKLKSNVEELSARDSTICAISQVEFEKADDFIAIKSSSHYMLEFFEMMIALQLLALEISIRLGNDVDMPRNLAKSVTVE